MDLYDFRKSARAGDVETVRRGLQEGVDVNTTNSKGTTALHLACEMCREAVVELLIKNGADLNVTNNDGDTALHKACWGVNDKDMDLCWEDHGKVLELLIENDADLNVTNNNGDTALHKACWRGNDKNVELLIKNGADLRVANNDGKTALHIASRVGHEIVVERLIKNGGHLNVTDKNGDTALHEACKDGHDKVVKLLIKNGADLQVTTKDGHTALHKACEDGHDKVVKLLIKHGADLRVTTQNGETALHKACRGGHGNIVELLIKNGADINVTTKDGYTILHAACAGGLNKIVELLIKNEADLNLADESGRAALHEASLRGHSKVLKLLIKNGAHLNVTTKLGDTALHEGCRKGQGEIVELLIKNGADVRKTNQLGDTALHEGCRKGQGEIVELLIKNGADVRKTNQAGDTALHEACRWNHGKIVELLIKNGANLLVANEEHKRPINIVSRLDRRTLLLLETETRKQEEYSELISSVGSEEGTTVKLFLCGDGQVGKTSLRAILKKTGLILSTFWNLKRKFMDQDAFNPTPGVHVSSKTVRGIGRLSLHDFAGQAQFYVTHAMLLRTTNAIFTVVYKITDGEDEQKQQVHGWLSFIHCSNADPTNKPRIVLIASHADKLHTVQDKQTGLRQATALVTYYRELFQESLIVSQEVFLINCVEAGSPEIQRLRRVLAAFRDDMLKQKPKVPKVCVPWMRKIEAWRAERKTFPVMGWQDYMAAVGQAAIYLEERIVQLASSYLHDEGEIIYLRHAADSSVVLDPHWLFTTVFGSLLAPQNFPIVRIARTADDYVTFEELTRVFRAVAEIPLLIKLLQDFQLCHTYNGHTFILPSLLEQEMEEAAWSPVSGKAVYFGLQIRCRTEIDSFSCDLFPRLQTLLMQAKRDKLCQPRLWKNSAKCTDGKAEALLQITQDKRQLNVFVRSNDGNREDCISIMDLLKDMTYRLLHKTSPGARSRDMVLSALDLREHRPHPHAYSREEVEVAAAKGENLVHPQRTVPEKVKDLLLHLGNLKGMLGRVAQKRPELVETLRIVDPILDHLYANDVINLDERDHIRAARTPQNAARELLDILEVKGEKACVKFHSILKTCNKYAASLIVDAQMSEEMATAS